MNIVYLKLEDSHILSWLMLFFWDNQQRKGGWLWFSFLENARSGPLFFAGMLQMWQLSSVYSWSHWTKGTGSCIDMMYAPVMTFDDSLPHWEEYCYGNMLLTEKSFYCHKINAIIFTMWSDWAPIANKRC